MANSSVYDVFEQMWKHVLAKFNSCVSNDVFEAHISSDMINPHNITKEQIGLNKVDNTSDLEKPVSRAIQVALDEKSDINHEHTAEDVGAISIDGGTMVGTLTVNGVILTEGIDYGSIDPSDGVLGQLYFKKVT